MSKHIDYPDLTPLLQPKSIAIVGASEDITKAAGLPLYFALKHKYEGKVFPVNPSRETVQGLKCYKSILDIPDPVDAALIVVPAAGVAGILRQCAQKGVKAAVLPVSGFAELGTEEGKKRQNEIDEIVRTSGIRICGPNSNGILSVHGKVSLGYSYAQEVVTPGRLAYVTQSGGILSAGAPRIGRRGIGISYFINAGNQADLESFDYARYVVDDPNTDVIAMYVEGVKNPEKFLDVADLALQKGKPLVMIKVGRSEVAAKAAMDHTASLVGSDTVFDAICKQKGVVRVDDFDNLIAAALVFLKCKLPKGNGVGMVSTSGAVNSLVGDHAIGRGLRFPDLSAKTKEAAAKLIPAYGEIKNPFDIGGAGATALGDVKLSTEAIQLLVNDENIDIVLAAVTPIDPRGTQNFLSAVVAVSKVTDKPIILFCPMTYLREEEEKTFAQSNIPMLFDAAECVNAISASVKFAEKVRKSKEPAGIKEPQIQVDVEAVKSSLKSGGKTLTEHESKSLLSRYGIATTKEAIARSPEEIRGVLVQEMVKDGREVIIRMSHDPQFGPTIMFGLGGLFVEVLKDISLRVAPITRADAEEMVKEVKGYKILEAFRGKPKADIESVIDTLLRVSRLSMDLGDVISEIDINPLIVLDEGKGVKVVDALVVLK